MHLPLVLVKKYWNVLHLFCFVLFCFLIYTELICYIGCSSTYLVYIFVFLLWILKFKYQNSFTSRVTSLCNIKLVTQLCVDLVLVNMDIIVYNHSLHLHRTDSYKHTIPFQKVCGYTVLKCHFSDVEILSTHYSGWHI